MNRFLALLVCLVLAESAVYSQSLAAVAEKEKERRKKNDTPVRVIDDDGLRQVDGNSVIVESSVSTGTKAEEERSDSKRPATTPVEGSRPETRSRKCEELKRSLVAAERRYKELVTYTYKVPGRMARGVKTGYTPDGRIITQDVQTYEERTKKVYCTSKEGMSMGECWSRKQEVENLRAQLEACR